MRLLVLLVLTTTLVSPAFAQVYPGKQLEVYDANDELVGQLLGALGYNWQVSVVTDSGEAAPLTFHQFPETAARYWFSSSTYYQSADCTGTPYWDTGDGQTFFAISGKDGNYYFTTRQGTVHRLPGTSASITVGSRWQGDSSQPCQTASGTRTLATGPTVGTVSTAFPFYVEEVPPSAPLLPLWAWGTIAGGLAVFGGVLTRRA